MRAWSGLRKANYVFIVKKNMRAWREVPTWHAGIIGWNMPVKWALRPNNNLTRFCVSIIIIFTANDARAPSSNAEKRCQTRSLAATGDSQPPARQGDRRTVRGPQLFRSQRLGTGQVRDASLRTSGQQIDHRRSSHFWFFAAFFLPGAVCIRTGRAARSGAAQTWPQAGAQAHRRGSRFHPRNASERPCDGRRRTGATDSSALWHYGASAKHPARVAAPSKKTPLSEPTDQPVARLDLVAHYEQLRRDATDMSSRGREALGLALFLRRGMAAWMQAWSKCLDCVTPPAPPQPATTPVPMDVRGQVAMWLAGIILGLHQEATT